MATTPGEQTDDITQSSSIDELIGNRAAVGTVRVSIDAVASQLLADGPIADAIGMLQAGYDYNEALREDLPSASGLAVGLLARVFDDGADTGVWRVTAGTPNTWVRIGDLPEADLAVLDVRLDAIEDAAADETTARTAADTAIDAAIDAVAGDLATETTARAAADTALDAAIDAVAGDLATETTARTAADTALDAAIDAVAEDLATEATARAAADTALNAAFDAGLTALAADVDVVDALYADLIGNAAHRPGDAPSLWSTAHTGAARSRPALAIGEVVVSSPLGSALRISGADIPDDVATSTWRRGSILRWRTGGPTGCVGGWRAASIRPTRSATASRSGCRRSTATRRTFPPSGSARPCRRSLPIRW
ncbi:hypothetical protein [Methylobrevis pamukkalensis]|uniref:Uncharacterized protein n=1 Tax=Methylobrevis pamukkalensis TaxID=1439726 RepID=A0A1E3H0M1_9HYPH|nr:hypothetical protein [Methylobrevis pamukkalensis]ODN69888.1 hypothetical protein A6302_02770 [Methylobrevis pamukkalensis]